MSNSTPKPTSAYYSTGAIIGDIIGSLRERNNERNTTFDLFPTGSKMTDDSMMTLATMAAILENETSPDYTAWYKKLYRLYPDAGYGKFFRTWAASDTLDPIDSFGNGSAMRVGPVGLVAKTYEEAMKQARLSASITHSHPEGIKGAQAIAGAVYLAKTFPDMNVSAWGKKEIYYHIVNNIGYDLDFTMKEIRKTYEFSAICQHSVPQAINAFLESDSFESAIRIAISIGGDSDTIAAMAGSIAEAYYGIPDRISEKANTIIGRNDHARDIIINFDRKYGHK